MFLSDDVILDILMPMLDFAHFIQLRAVNSHLYELITKNAEENDQIIKKDTQLILLKGMFKVTGDSMQRASIRSNQIMEEFNLKNHGLLFKFSDLDYAKSVSCPTIAHYYPVQKSENGIIKHPKGYGCYPAVYCVKCKIDLLLSPEKAKAWKKPETPIAAIVSSEYFDVVWHYDFLVGVRVYVDICTIM